LEDDARGSDGHGVAMGGNATGLPGWVTYPGGKSIDDRMPILREAGDGIREAGDGGERCGDAMWPPTVIAWGPTA
jgi:hypothetical protein